MKLFKHFEDSLFSKYAWILCNTVYTIYASRNCELTKTYTKVYDHDEFMFNKKLHCGVYVMELITPMGL